MNMKILLALVIGGLLFAVHPVATYATGYLVQRTILFATLFCLLAMLVWIKANKSKNGNLIWLSVPLYYFAVFSKENSAIS